MVSSVSSYLWVAKTDLAQGHDDIEDVCVSEGEGEGPATSSANAGVPVHVETDGEEKEAFTMDRGSGLST